MLHDFIPHDEYKIANSRGRSENVGSQWLRLQVTLVVTGWALSLSGHLGNEASEMVLHSALLSQGG